MHILIILHRCFAFTLYLDFIEKEKKIAPQKTQNLISEHFILYTQLNLHSTIEFVSF